MSQTATPAAVPPTTPMTKKEAQDFLTREIFIPACFNKLAGHGLVPADENEANLYLDICLKALNGHQAEQVKTAGSRADFLKEASSRLDQVLANRYGMTAPSQQKTAAEDSIRLDVDYLLQHASVREAVRAFHAA